MKNEYGGSAAHAEKDANPDPYDIELPQGIIDSFARFLVPEIRKYYESEPGQKDFAEWEEKTEKVGQTGKELKAGLSGAFPDGPAFYKTLA